MSPSYYRYWGKAGSSDNQPGCYHLFPYHSLDVAAVAAVWWNRSSVVQRAFVHASGLPANETRAWVLFFISLHDIGKLDVRFQLKAPVARQRLNIESHRLNSGLSPQDCQAYLHGPAGLYWLNQELQEIITGQPITTDFSEGFSFLDEPTDLVDPLWEVWGPWLEAVTGHHGHLVASDFNRDFALPRDAAPELGELDSVARAQWVRRCAELFLHPAGLTLDSMPPPLSPLLAGFCSVADWLGSATSEQTFCYQSAPMDCHLYFDDRCLSDAPVVLARSGLLGVPKSYTGVGDLLKKGFQPRQLQTLVDGLPSAPGMLLVEAPTGSGKTETALACAWRLIDAGLAESIVFALPTQATANAMLGRLEQLAPLLFERHPNLILAHGNARFNREFLELRQRGLTAQGGEEAWAECSDWLAQSRKRAFLGQVGVSTIDQVLVSVLPVKHRFIRGYGLGRSVLVVDEVHAYDTYMYGLLTAVLKEQRAAGGSAILLSATLPARQRRSLVAAWGVQDETEIAPESVPYPLISWCGDRVRSYTPNEEQQPPEREVLLEACPCNRLWPDEYMLQLVCSGAEEGANVVLVMNVVADAQRLVRQLRSMTTRPIHLFHARFTLAHRQPIENDMLARFGDEGTARGEVLVATQVVEQSLDLDFDWMITQLCPVDLLFQRLGRLHRHGHKDMQRPVEYRQPRCAVLLPDDGDYGVHEKIYGNRRVLWRTEQRVRELSGTPLCFPWAYRHWIEAIYAEATWVQEPVAITQAYEEYQDKVEAVKRMGANLILESTARMTPFADNDDHVRAVTRDGEMSLGLVPCLETVRGRQLLDGSLWDSIDEQMQPEALALNSVSVPAGWWYGWLEKHLAANDREPLWLPMQAVSVREGNAWSVTLGQSRLQYSDSFGLERIMEANMESRYGPTEG